jgi:hypothetical protein
MENFYMAQENLSSLHKIGWRPAEKKLPVFFNMRALDLDFYDSNKLVRGRNPTEKTESTYLHTFHDVSTPP